MKTLIAAALSGALLATSAQAALPPFYDSGWMIKTILESDKVEDAVHGFVTGVEYLGQSGEAGVQWRVRTQDCSATVTLRPLAMPQKDGVPMVGRVDYEIAAVSPCEK